jgi:hypothetical protein
MSSNINCKQKKPLGNDKSYISRRQIPVHIPINIASSYEATWWHRSAKSSEDLCPNKRHVLLLSGVKRLCLTRNLRRIIPFPIISTMKSWWKSDIDPRPPRNDNQPMSTSPLDHLLTARNAGAQEDHLATFSRKTMGKSTFSAEKPLN